MNEVNVLYNFETALSDVLVAILPLVALFLVFQVLLLKLPRSHAYSMLKGAFLASVGLVLFLQGVTIGLLPFGRAIGDALGTASYKGILVPVGFLLGFLTSWGEPSVRILAQQVDRASSGSLRQSTVLYAICIGVAFVVSLGMLRIAYGFPLLYLLVPGYTLVIVLVWFSEKEFLSIAADASGVATGPLSNTFLLAIALGIATSTGEQNAAIQGFGLLALIALAPLVSVMSLGFVFRAKRQKME